ncbi:MAG: hypothetical protein NTX53_08560 [candidate division WOR-3 bacterium]|nr:hypothetical protein [candidate division WOR-3 bacterium]
MTNKSGTPTAQRGDSELDACKPAPLSRGGFNDAAVLPYGCTLAGIKAAMQDYLEFLEFVNCALHTKDIARLESMLMPANFSSMVGEFMTANIPKHCPSLAKNTYHNGHPDLVPAGKFPNDAAQHSSEGIEVKASRYARGWQGHNPEDCFLLVFVFDSSRPNDAAKSVPPRRFRFVEVLGERLKKSDWLFAGRKGESRRTITASVTKSGYDKMSANWVYRDASLLLPE